MVDFTKGLVPIDTSPLMQFFETKKRDQQMALQNERQSKLDQLAQAEFEFSKQRAMKSDRMAQQQQQQKQQEKIQEQAQAQFVNYAVDVAGGVQAALQSAEENDGIPVGPVVSQLAKSIRNADQAFGGNSPFSELEPLVRDGKWEELTPKVVSLVNQIGETEQFGNQLGAAQDASGLMSPRGAESSANFANAGYYKAPGTDKWAAVFPTDNGFVDTRNNPVDVNPNGDYMDSIGLNASSAEGLPSGAWNDFLNKAVSAKNFNDTAYELTEILNDPNVSDANTIAGKFAGFTNNMRAEARAVGEMFNVLPEAGTTFDQLLNPVNYESNFREMGIVSGELKSIFTSLAYQAAAANGESSRISDRDIIRFLNQVGEGASDPQAIKRIVLRTAEDVSRGVRNEKDMKFPGNDWNNDLGLPRLRGAIRGTQESQYDFNTMSQDELMQLSPAQMNASELAEYIRALEGA